MRRAVPDFVDGAPLEVSCQRFSEEVYVLLTQHGGSMSLQHTMKPAQARQLAAYLNECADLLEPRVVPEIEGVPA